MKGVGYTEYIPKERKYTVVMLHGWGANRGLFARVAQFLADKADAYVVTIDFPGFGDSDALTEVWNTAKYVDFVFQFCDEHNIQTIDMLLGHSHGGRVSLASALRDSDRIKKLLLVGSAGIKMELPFRKKLKVWSFKSAKQLLCLFVPAGEKREQLLDRLRGVFGSSDYRSAGGTLRDTLVTVLNEDLAEELPRISQPTLLVWGSEDSDTPLALGKQMEASIPDAGLVVWEGAGHYAFLDRQSEFEAVAKHFLTT